MDNHPLLAVQLFTLGDLASLVDLDVARKVYYWCKQVSLNIFSLIIAELSYLFVVFVDFGSNSC
jgi:hypothetical protein